MSESCAWLHKQLEGLKPCRYSEELFEDGQLPENGIYFFYQRGETWGHGGNKPRIVRVGTHRGQGNFPHRIGEHFLTAGRSIFRGNIGRALLRRDGNEYLKIWTLDFIAKGKRLRGGSLAELEQEERIQRRVTQTLRKNFWFRFIVLNGSNQRKEWESRLIGTVASCALCQPSGKWLGRGSPIPRICGGKMWLVQHVGSAGLSVGDKRPLLAAINTTEKWIKSAAQKTRLASSS